MFSYKPFSCSFSAIIESIFTCISSFVKSAKLPTEVPVCGAYKYDTTKYNPHLINYKSLHGHSRLGLPILRFDGYYRGLR